ncbi:deoxycytidylate deaminase-like [Coccinella septempunctata]|uniref:deoxycytidylate deaminase-like n=1 Tax=Coccinella septempunctata TaxID=41139 RepID=UPI001D06D026|nr:deoxycytidylate deaminase-like [Coccinella septempunctata]
MSSGQFDNERSPDDNFMKLAVVESRKSEDPVTKVGACIVKENKKIVGRGYNTMPNGCDFPWHKKQPNEVDNKKYYVCHAELNAVLSAETIADLKDCTIYVTLFPCNECAKIIIQVGIKEVVYLSDKYKYKNHTIASRRMLDAAGVKYRQHLL